MVTNELIDEILALDAADREYVLRLVSASLSKGLPAQLSPEDQQELLRRVERFEKDPDSFIRWEEVKSKLMEQRRGSSIEPEFQDD